MSNLVGPGPGPIPNVASVFGRTGIITAQNGDYNISQITGAVTGLQGALSLSGLTGGQVSLASLGTSGAASFTASGGTVTGSPAVFNPGTSFKVGDLLGVAGGNNDAVLVVLTVSGTAIATLGVAYGGTGYVSGTNVPLVAADTLNRRTIELSGTLTSNLTLLLSNGTPLANATRSIIFNNCAGAFTVTVQLSNGSNAPQGSGIVVPAGLTTNGNGAFIATDGISDVWFAASPTTVHPFASIFNPPATVPNPTAGQLVVYGGGAFPTFSFNGSGALWPTTTGGLVAQGKGSNFDFTLANSAGATVFVVPTGTVNTTWPGFALFNAPPSVPTMGAGQVAIFGQGANPTFNAAGQAAFWSTTSGGAVVQGQGSSFDGQWLNSAGLAYLQNPTGTVNTSWPGVALFNVPPSIPTIGAGQLAVFGALALPSGALTAAGSAAVWSHPTNGLNFRGFGTTGNSDIIIQNGLGQPAFTVPFQSVTPQVPSGLTLTPHAAVSILGTITEDPTQQTLTVFEGSSTVNGIKIFKSGLIYSSFASVTVGTGSLFSASFVGSGLTVPANFLVAGKVVRLIFTGLIQSASTPGTMTITVALGSSSISMPFTALAASSSGQFRLECYFVVYSTGTSGTLLGTGQFLSAGNAVLTGGLGTGGTSVINTTVANTISATVTTSGSGGTGSTLLDVGMSIAEILA